MLNEHWRLFYAESPQSVYPMETVAQHHASTDGIHVHRGGSIADEADDRGDRHPARWGISKFFSGQGGFEEAAEETNIATWRTKNVGVWSDFQMLDRSERTFARQAQRRYVIKVGFAGSSECSFLMKSKSTFRCGATSLSISTMATLIGG